MRARYYTNGGRLLDGLLYDRQRNEGKIKLVTGEAQTQPEVILLAFAGRMDLVITADDKELTWRDLGRLICRYGG